MLKFYIIAFIGCSSLYAQSLHRKAKYHGLIWDLQSSNYGKTLENKLFYVHKAFLDYCNGIPRSKYYI